MLPLKIPLVALGAMMEGTSERGAGLLRRYLSERENLAPRRVECLEQALTHGAIMILLDGLDEATTQIASVLDWIDDMTAAHPRLRVALSSRPVAGVDRSALASRGFRFLQVQPLTPSQVRWSLSSCRVIPRLLVVVLAHNTMISPPALPPARLFDGDSLERRCRCATWSHGESVMPLTM